MKKRFVPIFLAVVMMFSISTSFAAVQASTCLNSYSIGLYSEGDGVMLIEFQVVGTNRMDKIGAYSFLIEQEILPDVWVLYDTIYGDDDDSTYYSYDTIIHHDSCEFVGTPGFRYRVTLTAYAELDSDSDTGEVTSAARLCT